MIRLSSEPGTYAMIFRSRHNVRVRVGRWGYLTTEPGYYIYIGSAFGPGGVSARVARHCRLDKRERWHIDYLRKVIEPISMLCCYSAIRLEHDWAQSIIKMKGITAIKGFGCSDCTCLSHLFYTAVKPDVRWFRRITDAAIDLVNVNALVVLR